MKVSKSIFIKQCDMNGCGKIATYTISYDEKNSRSKVCLCSECLDAICKGYNKIKPKRSQDEKN